MDKLGISSSTLHRIVQEGNFTEDGETIRFRGKRLYRKDAVEKYFKDWGWRGAIGNGAVCFKAEVSVWEYIEPDPEIVIK